MASAIDAVTFDRADTLRLAEFWTAAVGHGMAAEVERLIGLGALRVEAHRESGLTLTVMADPESNEFCVWELPWQRGGGVGIVSP